MLMCILRVWDEMHECFVGAQELKEEREREREAEFQAEHASASQHPRADHDFKECSSCNGGSEYVSGFKRLELWQRVGIVCGWYALMFEEFPMMTLMMLYLFTLAVIGTIMWCMRSQPIVIVKGVV